MCLASILISQSFSCCRQVDSVSGEHGVPRLHPHHPERQLRALLRRVLPAEDVLHGEPVQGAAADGGDVGDLGAADLALPSHHLHGHGVPLRRPRQRHHLHQPHLRGLALRLHHR